jgi:predicted O-linked N-acetylglucosamine transferase (SPINDLY family)
MAADHAGLARMRQALRDQVRASPLCDATDLARVMEATFHDLARTPPRAAAA